MTLKDFLTLVFDKLPWPIMAGVAVFLLRKPLDTLLNRVSKLGVGKNGLTLDASAPQIQAEAETQAIRPEGLTTAPTIGQAGVLESSATEKRREEVQNFDVLPVIREQEQLIYKDLKALNLADHSQETINVLVKHLATTQVLLYAEQIYRLIFGSQILMLFHLNAFGATAGAELKAKFYDHAKKNYPTFYINYSLGVGDQRNGKPG